MEEVRIEVTNELLQCLSDTECKFNEISHIPFLPKFEGIQWNIHAGNKLGSQEKLDAQSESLQDDVFEEQSETEVETSPMKIDTV